MADAEAWDECKACTTVLGRRAHVPALCLLCPQVPQKLRFRSAGAQQTGVVISDHLNCVSGMVCAEVCSECGVHVCMDM